MIVMSLAFEIKHRVNDVFENLWTSDRTLFGYVPNQKNRNAAILREHEKLMRDFPHLRNRTRRRFDRARKNRLDRIDYYCAGLEPVDFVDDVFEIGLGQEIDVFSFDSKPFASQLDLAFRLFTGNVEHERAGVTEFVGHLKQQRALTNAGIAAYEDECAGYDAAAEDTIKFRDTGRNANVVLRFDLNERNRGDVAKFKAVTTA